EIRADEIIAFAGFSSLAGAPCVATSDTDPEFRTAGLPEHRRPAPGVGLAPGPYGPGPKRGDQPEMERFSLTRRPATHFDGPLQVLFPALRHQLSLVPVHVRASFRHPAFGNYRTKYTVTAEWLFHLGSSEFAALRCRVSPRWPSSGA